DVRGAGLVWGDVDQLVQDATFDDVADQGVEGGRLGVKSVGALGLVTVPLVGAGDEGDPLAGFARSPGDGGAGRDVGGGVELAGRRDHHHRDLGQNLGDVPQRYQHAPVHG